MKVAVLGSGAWGTALAQVLVDNKHDVTIYGIVKSQVEDIQQRHINSAYFQLITFPSELKATMDINEAVKDADFVIIAVPTFAVASTTAQIDNLIKKDAILVTVSKGFDPNTHDLMGDIIKKNLTTYHPIVVLAGPSFAIEVVKRELTTVTAASYDEKAAETIQKIFSNDYFRVYTNDDEIGAEICGAMKNIIALASGICAGMGYGTNARSGLITRGLVEMSHFVRKLGGKVETIYGLTGVGDLILTCSSMESRNFQVGNAIGRSLDAKSVLANNKLTAEGVKASQILHEKAKKYEVDMPICEAVYETLYENKNPKDLVQELMHRPLRSEKYLVED